MHHEADVRFVDAHAEGDGRYDDQAIFAQKTLLVFLALGAGVFALDQWLDDGDAERRVIEVTEGPVELPDGQGGMVAITCGQTDHKPVEPSVGFRFDGGDGASVVVAGDTVPCAGLDSLCEGADALVHTVIEM